MTIDDKLATLILVGCAAWFIGAAWFAAWALLPETCPRAAARLRTLAGVPARARRNAKTRARRRARAREMRPRRSPLAERTPAGAWFWDEFTPGREA